MADEPKTCCYKTQYRPFDDPGTPCQFMIEAHMADRLIDVGGLTFCPYHLPHNGETLKQDYNANEYVAHKQLKQNWPRDRVDAFRDDIHQRLDQARAAGVRCDLTGVVFPGHMSFRGKEMPEVTFGWSQFAGGCVDFTDTVFCGGPANFRGALFSGGYAEFGNSKFSGGPVDFSDTVFSGGYADFESVDFSSGRTTFNNALFSGGHVYFSFSQFSAGPVEFVGAQFSGGSVDFRDAYFRDLADFSTDSFQNPETPSDENFRIGFFSRVKFAAGVLFNNRGFSDHTDFSQTIFAKAPEFHGCDLHQDTIFPQIANFQDTQSDGAAHAYRTLRLAMKQQEAHEEEAMFWALEQRSKRNNLDRNKPKNWFPWALSWGYDTLSNYGLNAGLPARWLGGWILYSTIIYACVAGSLERLASVDHWLGALGFSIAQMARPFFIWGDYDGSDIRAALGSNEFSFLIKMLATVDSIVSLTLVALFILAVRRRFRMQ